MSGSQAFLDRYWSTPELEVSESGDKLCEKCNSISFASFRAATTFDETFRPATLVLGGFPTLSKSASAGCPICRLIVRAILQDATTLHGCILVKHIAKIGLRLNLDDHLSLHCWTADGQIYPLLGHEALGLRLEDSDAKTDDSNILTDYEWVEFDGAKILAHCQENEFLSDPEPNPDLVQSWLVTCSAAHDQCSDWMEQVGSEDLPVLPTRVLHLGHQAGTRVIESNGERGHYVTLSHCWGQSNHAYKLDRQNKTSMMTHIDLKDLPKSFREAAQITMRMGFQYLWIDSLCIIQPTQGDLEDWINEGPRMAEYYRNSVFTIAASAGLDSDWGCFFRAPSTQYKVKPWPLFREPVQRKWDEFSLAMNRDPSWLPVIHPQPCSWLWHVQNCPLNTRAWVLQERLLSKRILHCTLQGLMWECPELRATELEPLGCQYDYAVRDEGLLQIDEALKQGTAFVIGRYWRQVVERFSKLNIAHSSDRLPALAGLAKAIQEETRDCYVVGLWKGSFLPSLLWFRVKGNELQSPSRLPNAPSWTWASTSGQIKFTSLDKLDYPQRDSDSYNITAELLDINVLPLTSNSFSWVSSSSVRIRGYWRKAEQQHGCPELQSVNRTDEDCWHGYAPSKFRDEGNTIININMSSMPDRNAGPVTEDVALRMADIVSDHDLLQSQIKSEVSRAFEGHSLELPVEEEKPDTLECVFDLAQEEEQCNLLLLEILREVNSDGQPYVSEGLVLASVEGDTSFRRVGFFTSSTKVPLFVDADLAEVILN